MPTGEFMPLSRAGKWAVWVSSCVLAAVTIVIAVKSIPLKSQPRAGARSSQAAAIAQPPRAPVQRGGAPQPMMSRAARLPQHIALDTLRLNGIVLRSNGDCTNRRNASCTSLEGVRRGSVEGLIAFKRQSKCRIIVSGGTEIGHARGRYSHWNGYKIDVLPNSCVDRFIHNRFRPVGTRGDGAELYRSPNGVLYADEGHHWDLLYK
jgi:hypothetical protein